MAIETHYLFTASMDVDPDKEDIFNEVYDTEHIPNLYQVPGLISVTRLVNQPFTMATVSYTHLTLPTKRIV